MKWGSGEFNMVWPCCASAAVWDWPLHWNGVVYRQNDRKRRTLTQTLAFCADGATMQLNEVLHDRQPQAKTAVASRRAAVRLSKAIENVGQKLRSDSLTAVSNDHAHVIPCVLQRHVNNAARRRELDRIGQQIP